MGDSKERKRSESDKAALAATELGIGEAARRSSGTAERTGQSSDSGGAAQPAVPTPAPASGDAPTEAGGAGVPVDPGPRRLPTPVLVEDEEDEGPDLMLGRVLSGLYKVETRIGEGGMGAVYSATHIHLNKRFAIKVLSRKIAAHKQAVERLRQEAVAASSIEHDNIVDVVSFDTTDDGDVFIVMELLKGSSLAELVERHGRLPLGRALAIGHQICRALSAAHENGIVHRDLKPENVFIVEKRDGEAVKVLDFGISKVKSAESQGVRMTRTGQLVGTPLYMSPEQAKGEADVDSRADIYALGVILYEMLTGVPPFEGGNYFQLLWKHGNEPPVPPSERVPGVHIPAALEQVILRCLEKVPDDRFHTMRELGAAMAAAVPEVPVPIGSLIPTAPMRESMPTVPAQRPRALVVGAGIGALAIAVGGIAWAASGSGGTETPPVVDPATEPVVHKAPREVPVEPAAPDALPRGVDVEGGDPPPVTLRFRSRPSGATVTFEDQELCTTPCTAPVATTDPQIEVTFSKRGRRDAVVSAVPAEGVTVEARLPPSSVGGTGPPTGVKGWNE